MSWIDAEHYCNISGGHLVTIRSKEDQIIIAAKIKESTGTTWIRARHVDTEGSCFWTDGTHMEYDNWYKNNSKWINVKVKVDRIRAGWGNRGKLRCHIFRYKMGRCRLEQQEQVHTSTSHQAFSKETTYTWILQVSLPACVLICRYAHLQVSQPAGILNSGMLTDRYLRLKYPHLQISSPAGILTCKHPHLQVSAHTQC